MLENVALRVGTQDQHAKMKKLVVSLTSIPSRVHKIGPALDSLLNQNVKADEVLLWIPKTSRRKSEYINEKDIDVPAGVILKLVDFDFGPASKILHAVKHFGNRDVGIIYCDDDKIYDRNFI